MEELQNMEMSSFCGSRPEDISRRKITEFDVFLQSYTILESSNLMASWTVMHSGRVKGKNVGFK